MPTPIFICGAECGIAAVGTAGPDTEHWSSVGNVPAVSTTTVNSAQGGVRSFRFNTAGATVTLQHGFAAAIASPATAVGRFYVYFAALPSVDSSLCTFTGSVASFGAVRFVASDSTIRARALTTNAAAGFVVTTGVWYRIDVKAVSNTTATCDIQVDGVAQTQASVGSSAGTCTSVTIGSNGAGTADVFIDDIIVSGTSADFPIGAGGVAGLYPSGDGVHSYSATNDFLDGGTAQAALAAAGSEVDTWLSLRSKADGGLSTTVDNSNFVTNATGATNEWLRWVAENLPAAAASVNGVASVSTHHAASTTTNAQSLFVVDISAGGASPSAVAKEITVLGTAAGGVWATGSDLSDTTIIVVYKVAATAETTGAWTVANVNDLGWIWGSTDVNPDAYIDGVCLEVDYVAGGAISPVGATVSVTAGTPAIALHFAPTGATVSVTPGTPTVALVQNVTPTGATVAITPGTPALRLSVTPTGATVTVLAGTPSIAQSVTPTGATVTVTPGSPTFLHVSPITPTGATVSVTPGTPAIALSIAPSATVTVTPGTPAIALAITPTGATVNVTTGTPTLDLAIAPTGATVSVTPGTATVANASGPQDVTPVGATVAVTAGMPAIALSIAPTGATVSIVAGTPELALSITPSATVDVTPGTPSFLNPSPQAITPVGATVSVTAGTPAVALSIAPTAPTVNVTAGTVTLDLNVTPSGATVSVTPGTASISAAAADQAISPVGPTVTVAAGTPALALSVAPSGATVNVTPGTPSMALAITPTGPVVTITTGTPEIALTLAPDGATVTIAPGTPALALAVAPIAALVTVLAGTVTVEREALGGGFPPFLSTDFRVRPHDSALASVGRSTLIVSEKRSGEFTVRAHESDLEVNQHD